MIIPSIEKGRRKKLFLTSNFHKYHYFGEMFKYYVRKKCNFDWYLQPNFAFDKVKLCTVEMDLFDLPFYTVNSWHLRKQVLTNTYGSHCLDSKVTSFISLIFKLWKPIVQEWIMTQMFPKYWWTCCVYASQ